jgi:cysteinyl-tRNA synthetase
MGPDRRNGHDRRAWIAVPDPSSAVAKPVSLPDLVAADRACQEARYAKQADVPLAKGFAWMRDWSAALVAVIDAGLRLGALALRVTLEIWWQLLGKAILMTSRAVDWWRRSGQAARLLAVAAVAGAALVAFAGTWRDELGNWYDVKMGRRPLLAATSWYYHLGRIDVDVIARSDADLVVTDHARDPLGVPLTPAEVARLKIKPDGTRRLVVSYMSIGEADAARPYWQTEWSKPGGSKPAWHVMENCAWPRAHAVRFWHPAWKEIIATGENSYLKQIIRQGFDGVYLDRVDIFERFETTRPSARAEMIDFVAEIGAIARAMKPDFLIIPQNGEDLLKDRRYRRVIDGLGKEDLLFGHDGTGVRNPAEGTDWSLGLMRKLQRDRKPVFAVEYLVTREAIAEARGELLRLGLVPTFQHRSLDGSNPTLPRLRSDAEHGSPEWIARNCTKDNAW